MKLAKLTSFHIKIFFRYGVLWDETRTESIIYFKILLSLILFSHPLATEKNEAKCWYEIKRGLLISPQCNVRGILKKCPFFVNARKLQNIMFLVLLKFQKKIKSQFWSPSFNGDITKGWPGKFFLYERSTLISYEQLPPEYCRTLYVIESNVYYVRWIKS